MRGPLVAALVIGLGGCATAASHDPPGPAPAVLADLLGTDRNEAPELRGVQCDFIPEEGSEWVCRYEERAGSGSWVGLSTVVAKSGSGWLLIDRPCSADEALADRGRCRR
ncbi:hypothetical protein [Brevundimonas poindexterae]|uniref:hypothetical protein n=1 Tax=Brevundimonas poindexterae TaxID=74325 RepID=UPI001CFEDEAE|nr:hypothetical protein [Brevundimonas poindexterae]